MLENHMVLPSSAPTYGHLEPEREEVCIACKRTACLTSDGWYTETVVEFDGKVAYLAGDGDYLPDAERMPLGFCCSLACRSQAMYDHADKYEREALRKVRDACLMIIEFGKIALRFTDEAMDVVPPELTDEAQGFLHAIADDGNGSPEWCNRPTREESMEQAIFRARIRLESLSAEMGLETKCRVNDGHTWDWQVIAHATHAATCGEIALELKEEEIQ